MKKKIVTCDKCGADIPCYNNMAISENSALIQLFGVGECRTAKPQRIDLCPECCEKFVNWLESEAEE